MHDIKNVRSVTHRPSVANYVNETVLYLAIKSVKYIELMPCPYYKRLIENAIYIATERLK